MTGFGGGTDDKERTHEDVTVVLELIEAVGPMALGFAGAVLYKVLEDTVVAAVKKRLVTIKNLAYNGLHGIATKGTIPRETSRRAI